MTSSILNQETKKIKKMMKTQVEERFTEFYEKWVHQLEENLQLLITASENPPNQREIEALVSKLTAQHKEYYTEKWAAAHEDILAFFSPVWLSPLENAYLWLTGWKPSTAFQLINSLQLEKKKTAVNAAAAGASLAGMMSEDQKKQMEALRVKIQLEEGKVEREMERQQMSIADRRMVELARFTCLSGGGRDGVGPSAVARRVDGLVEVALKSLSGRLEKLMKAADCVRLKTLKGVLDVLSPLQCVDFLAANSMLLIQLGKWGQKKDQKRLFRSFSSVQ